MLGRLSLLALLVAVVAVTATAPAARAQNMATVQGTIYDLWTFEPVENVVIKVYSGSALHMQTVALDGTYSLSLPPGSYTIEGKKYYSENTVIADAQENITVQAGDNLTLDLILFPTYEEESPDVEPIEEEEAGVGVFWLGIVAVLIVAVVVTIIIYHRRILRLVEKEVTASSSTKVVGVPDDLEEVLNVVREGGGRINQVELRQKLPYSEAKVSLMISDLEDRGLVRKIKKGRGNIVVLSEK